MYVQRRRADCVTQSALKFEKEYSTSKEYSTMYATKGALLQVNLFFITGNSVLGGVIMLSCDHVHGAYRLDNFDSAEICEGIGPVREFEDRALQFKAS